MDQRGQHWDAVYATKAAREVSWYQARPTVSLRLLGRWASPSGTVVDIGAGSATLVAALVDQGFAHLTVVEVSSQALRRVRRALRDRAQNVSFICADVTRWQPQETFDAWHDRAVFHFLVDPAERQAYVDAATQALAPGGVVVLGTFAADGPTQCSGLPTARYDAADLAATFSPAFSLEHTERQEHRTPAGVIQPFTWVVLRRLGSP